MNPEKYKDTDGSNIAEETDILENQALLNAFSLQEFKQQKLAEDAAKQMKKADECREAKRIALRKGKRLREQIRVVKNEVMKRDIFSCLIWAAVSAVAGVGIGEAIKRGRAR